MIIDYMEILHKLASKKEPLTRKEEDTFIKLMEWYNKHLEKLSEY